MLKEKTVEQAKKRAFEYLTSVHIIINETEKSNIEVTDFGLDNLGTVGLQLITYINTDKCCAKELVLFPNQICPEHRHPCIGMNPGKEETFRCRFGEVYLYVPGIPQGEVDNTIAGEYKKYFTVWHQIVLHPGEQYTLEPNTLHWFQAGKEGAIISEFSTKSNDLSDIFTDPRINRVAEILPK